MINISLLLTDVGSKSWTPPRSYRYWMLPGLALAVEDPTVVTLNANSPTKMVLLKYVLQDVNIMVSLFTKLPANTVTRRHQSLFPRSASTNVFPWMKPWIFSPNRLVFSMIRDVHSVWFPNLPCKSCQQILIQQEVHLGSECLLMPEKGKYLSPAQLNSKWTATCWNCTRLKKISTVAQLSLSLHLTDGRRTQEKGLHPILVKSQSCWAETTTRFSQLKLRDLSGV